MAEYIDDVAELKKLCKSLKGTPALGVDTEFIGEHSYFPKLALIQLAVKEQVWLVDPVVIEDLSPLAEVIADPATTVIMHDAECDAQILHRALNCNIGRLFDTQLAAAFVGLPEKTGLATLIRRLINKRVSKGQQVTNWLKRPLSNKQLEYAAQDVLYLDRIYHILSERLTRTKRGDFFLEEQATHMAKWMAPIDVTQRFKKMFPTSRMTVQRQAGLKQLLTWREHTAMERDVPRRHVLSDEAIMALAQQLPQTNSELKTLRLVSDKARSRYGENIMSICRQLSSLPRDAVSKGSVPTRSNGKRTSSQVPVIKMALEVLATQAGIAPGLIARVGEIEEICRHAAIQAEPPELPSMTGWRGRLVGRKLWKFARGKAALRVGMDRKGPAVLLEE